MLKLQTGSWSKCGMMVFFVLIPTPDILFAPLFRIRVSLLTTKLSQNGQLWCWLTIIFASQESAIEQAKALGGNTIVFNCNILAGV